MLEIVGWRVIGFGVGFVVGVIGWSVVWLAEGVVVRWIRHGT